MTAPTTLSRRAYRLLASSSHFTPLRARPTAVAALSQRRALSLRSLWPSSSSSSSPNPSPASSSSTPPAPPPTPPYDPAPASLSSLFRPAQPAQPPPPCTSAYATYFVRAAHKAGYRGSQLTTLLAAEEAAGRVPPGSTDSVRLSLRVNGITAAFLGLFLLATFVYPVMRRGSALWGRREEREGEWKKRVAVEYPRPRRMGDRGGEGES